MSPNDHPQHGPPQSIADSRSDTSKRGSRVRLTLSDRHISAREVERALIREISAEILRRAVLGRQVGARGCDVVAFGGTLEGRDSAVGDEAGGGAGDVDVVDFGDLDWERSAGMLPMGWRLREWSPE
jgi:hypothetical protein